jgi:MSHA biogenesis protein MshL
MKWNTLALFAPLALTTACSSMYPAPDLSTQERVTRELTQAASNKSGTTSSVMPPAVLNELLLPSINSLVSKPSSRSTEQRFDLVVNDAPIAQVLSGLVAGTEYSIMLKPISAQSATSGAEVLETRVSLNLKNITLFQALDALRDVYGYDYTVDKQRILVQPAQLQTQLYYVNYILGQRRGVSDLQVIGGASVGHSSSSSSSTTGSTSTTSSYASVQASGLSTTVKSDVWGEAEDALRTVLGCNIPKAIATPVLARPTTSTQGNASRADVTHPSDAPLGERLRGSDGCTQGRALSINQMSGTILARGMPSELRTVEKMLKSMQLSISRQVIIESKIIDVELNKDSQQGINWGSFQNGLHRFSVGASSSAISTTASGQPGGALVAGSTLQSLLGTNQAPANAMSSVSGIAMQTRNFSALINFLESQGRVHVLSSPRIATLNNQKAVLKVGSEEPFVTSITGGSTTVATGGTPVSVPPTLSYQPFFSGISLDVTPQIDSEDNITLHVHSMVNNVVEKSKLALLDASAEMVPFAVNTINETDSVVKAKDGQVIVIGGLMTERSSDVRSGVPGARDIPGVGAFFNWGAQTSVKRELVILLKSTVVKDDSTWSDDITATGNRIGTMNNIPR